MPARLCILGCRNFRQEVRAAIAAEGWADVVSADFPARCGCPPVKWEALRALIPVDCTEAVVVGRACLKGLTTPPEGFPPIRLLPQTQCFQLAVDAALVADALADGGYLITPGWLADWQGHVAEMGFSPATLGQFFKEFSSRLVLFDTGIDPNATANLAEFANAVGLPAIRVPVGLDHIRFLLARTVLEWRLAEAQRNAACEAQRHASELADHVAAMDLLAELARTQSEADAISAIEAMFTMLFAPHTCYYLRVERGLPVAGGTIPADVFSAMHPLDRSYAWTPSGQGFVLRIAHGDQTLGVIAVDGLAFPEYRERYLNLALAITGVCGLPIENARTRKQLLENAKMAALGVMVAGVAHEINTPVGVGLAAASTLEARSQGLAERFAARSMTQSDLRNYLEGAQAEAALIRANLARIAQLVDAFRNVAIEDKSPVKQRLAIKACAETVVASLHERLTHARVTVCVICDESLEIESFPSDWASIFTNLMTNSLRHGFKDRPSGEISIIIATHGAHLAVDYTDNGSGLSAETQARVFDPFFTTDLQQGTGLGMHMVFNLVVHRLGGTISCISAPNPGAHFHIEVPL